LFYGYVGLLILAGHLAPGTRADVMSQYRFMRAIELGFGL
jgi:hypothetical protein